MDGTPSKPSTSPSMTRLDVPSPSPATATDGLAHDTELLSASLVSVLEEQMGRVFVDLGPQNSRGFRALKVWLALRHAGASGYRRMISDDILLSRALADAVEKRGDLQLVTQDLSITTFRYIP